MEEDKKLIVVNWNDKERAEGFQTDVLTQDGNGIASNFPGFVFDEDKEEGFEPLPVETPMVWPELDFILKAEVEKLAGKPDSKKKRKEFYEALIKKLDERAEGPGFENVELEALWKLISYDPNFLNCKLIKSMIFSMIPREKVNASVIQSMVKWLGKAMKKGFKPSIIVCVYQLLILYGENNLAELGTLAHELTLTRALSAPTQNSVIPWKMTLFRTICTPQVLGKMHIKEMTKLLKNKTMKKTQMEDIKKSMLLTQHVRPDMFEEEEIMSASSLRELQLPPNVRQRFSKCAARVLKQSGGTFCHPLASKVFPEYLPAVFRKKTPFIQQSGLEYMLELLETNEGIAKLVCNAVLMSYFRDWLKQIIDHKFHPYPFCGVGGTSIADAKRYVFIFEVCSTVCAYQRRGIPEVNAWLIDFLCVWDFSTYRQFVFDMISYLLPSDILPYGDVLGPNFVDQFLFVEDDRLEIWASLESLYARWAMRLIAAESQAEKESFDNGLLWLINVLEELVSGILLTGEDLMPEENPLLVHKIVMFYKALQCEFFQKDYHNTETIKEAFALPKALSTVICLSENIGNIKIVEGFLLDGNITNDWKSLNPSVKSNAIGMSSFMTGLLDLGVDVDVQQKMEPVKIKDEPKLKNSESESRPSTSSGDGDLYFKEKWPLAEKMVYELAKQATISGVSPSMQHMEEVD